MKTKNKKTKHRMHPKLKRQRQTEKAALANKTNYAVVWYAFRYLRPWKQPAGWRGSKWL